MNEMKTYKLYVGGAFVRSESGRVTSVTSVTSVTPRDAHHLRDRGEGRHFGGVSRRASSS